MRSLTHSASGAAVEPRGASPMREVLRSMTLMAAGRLRSRNHGLEPHTTSGGGVRNETTHEQ